MRDQVSSCGARVSYESLQGGISVVKAIVGANLSYSSFEDIRKECSWMNGSWVK